MSFQYQQLMGRLMALIDSQKVVAHQQLPSIRELGAQYDVSLNTVKRCYSALEAKGYVYARNKSGYYVAQRKSSDYPRLNTTALTISKLDLLNDIHAAAAHKERVPLGSVQLSPTLFPIEAIRRSLKRSATYLKPENFLLAPKQGEPQLQQGLAKACVLTANYQNPLAYCLPDGEKQKIAELAARYRFPVIEDDVYGECGFSPRRPLPIRHWDTQGYVIWCGSTSKTLSRNFRVGWCVGGEGIAGFRAKFIALNSTVNTPLQLYLADFIYSRAYRAYLSRLGSKLRVQVQQYREKVLAIFGDKCQSVSQPQGGYWLWIELPEGNDSLQLYQQAMQQQINIVPGVVFGEQQDFSRYIRINAGVPLNPAIEKALQQLADLIKV